MDQFCGLEVRKGTVVATTPSMAKHFGRSHSEILGLVKMLTDNGLNRGVQVCEEGFTLEQGAASNVLILMDLPPEMQKGAIGIMKIYAQGAQK